jgi:hypothetical protein
MDRLTNVDGHANDAASGGAKSSGSSGSAK